MNNTLIIQKKQGEGISQSYVHGKQIHRKCKFPNHSILTYYNIYYNNLLLFLCMFSFILLSIAFISCGKKTEITRENALTLQTQYATRIQEKTVTKPGPPKYTKGRYGGNYHSTIPIDIKSFNMVVLFDATSSALVQNFFPYLFNYDPYIQEFTPHLAEHFEISYDEENNISYVDITLRDNTYWTTINERKTKLTSDDAIFWYNEVEGDKRLQMSAYSGQFVNMEDGNSARIKIQKVDALRFRFIIPRIVANPLLLVNMNFAPKYIYEKAKKENGVQGLIDVLSIDTPPSEIPSIGPYLLSKYVPSQRIVLVKNPNYWLLDSENTSLPYIEKKTITIANKNTSLLMLKNKEISENILNNNEIDELISIEDPHFTIYNAGTVLSARFFSFNQNASAVDEHKLRWFTSKKFRQAMSSAVPRQRIIDEVHRGLGEPALHFFAKANQFYDPSIRLQYTYNMDRARTLLEEDGFYLKDSVLYDRQDVAVEFELMMNTSNKDDVDSATIFTQELEKLGIKANIRPIDFQNMVEKLNTSYDWDALIIGLGANFWPTGGANVWPSNGRLHLWYPLQESPVTEWEARIDELYSLGKHVIAYKERKNIYDEYQHILLEELPIIYIAHVNRFVAIDTKIKNVYIDNLQGSEAVYHYFAP